MQKQFSQKQKLIIVKKGKEIGIKSQPFSYTQNGKSFCRGCE